MGNILTIKQQLALCALVSKKDIKAALFSIPNTKSPGLDGFYSGFFKSTWHIIGGIVKDAIQHIFHTRKMPEFLRETKFVLLPKVQQPT